MPKPDPFAKLRASYAATTLGSPEARVAVAVTLAVTLLVLLLARVPLRGELAIDFSEGDRIGGAVQSTLIGFSVPDANGRTTVGPLARVVFNRPLPAEFVLTIDGRLEPPAAGDPAIDVAVGEQRQALRFDASGARREIRVRNPGGAREISLELAGGARLRVQRIAILAADDLG